tara:strand:+ start:1206 stop:1388 length:183 start_codon:yes stop_codon:yes gene_type:complete
MKQKDIEFNKQELNFIRQEISSVAYKFMDKGQDVPEFLQGILKKCEKQKRLIKRRKNETT